MRFPGIIPALTTPFGPDGAVDHAALERNATALLDAGVHGFVATGTMGEAGSLSAAERRAVIATAARAAAGRAPVIAGVSSGTPEQSLAYARDAEAEGAVAIMLLPPLGYRGDERETIAFYRAVADGTDLPIMLYNNPEASGTDLPAALIARIAAEVDQVVAVKECSGDARRIPAILAAAPHLEVLVGGDDWALEGFASGATGWVSGVADCVPADCVALYEACQAYDFETARPIAQRLLPLSRLDMTPHLVQYFKAAQDALGFAGGPVRAPRLELDDARRATLEDALAALKAPVAA
ncbi:MAG TPA: dihydrodipicolinate synthase family protein [Solirubrobacteraceae bacterium]|nr:dihydrodipicolinate synthase family protein [Solirubrobacteraceae bacterium]